MGQKKYYIILGIIGFFIIGILAFDVYVFKFGKFWEKKPQPTTSKILERVAPTETLLDKARKLLIKIMPTIMVPALIPDPAKLSLVQDKITPESFMVSWETKEATIGGRLAVGNDGKNISSFYLSILTQPGITLSADLAKATAAQFFSITPQGKWACKTLKNETYCENFWEEKSGIKRGMGIQGPFTFGNKEKGIAVFFCEHSRESSIYSWQSCTTEFAKTGVR